MVDAILGSTANDLDFGLDSMSRLPSLLSRLRSVFAGAIASAGALTSPWADAQTSPAPTPSERSACARGRSPAAVAECLKPRIWYEYGLATLTTGLSSSGEFIGREMKLVVVGPGEEGVSDDAERAIRQQHRLIIKDLESKLRRTLDFSVQAGDDLLAQALKTPSTDLSKAIPGIRQSIAGQVEEGLLAATRSYEAQMGPTWQRFGVSPTQFHLAFVDLPCDPPHCNVAAYARKPENRSFDRYAKYKDWARSRGASQPSMVYLLQAGHASGRPDQLITQAAAAIRAARDSTWPREATVEENAARFERLVKQSRRTNFDVSTAVPEVIQLSQRSAIAVADVVKSPAYAISQLPANGNAVLKEVSDELARTRLFDCVRLRGATTPELAGACAGYQVSAIELAKCMNSDRCIPTYGRSMVLDVLAIGSPESIRKLANSNAFARMSLGTVAQLEAATKECAAGEVMPSHTVTASCVLKKRLGPRDRQTIDCIEGLQTRASTAGANAFAPCLGAAQVNETTRAQVNCVFGNPKDAQALALCTTMANMPVETRRLISCANGPNGKLAGKEAIAECLLKEKLPGIGAAVACVKSKQDWKDAALCAAGQNLPPEAKRALLCAQSNAGSVARMGVCMVGDSLPGDAGKVALCVAQTGGDPMGTAVCAASDGLTPEQRIALQCAMSSGGEPVSFAACTTGQLAIKEFMNCQGKKFGEYPCFGENNEFRKLAKNLGLEIGPKSVVADVINVHLQVLQGQVHLATEVLKETQKVAKALEQAGQAIGNGLDHLGREVVKESCKRLTFGMVRC